MISTRHRRHELTDNRSIDMTPMIDVVFQLILFFMLTSALVRPNQIELDLPESSTGTKAQEEQKLIVSYRLVEGKPEVKLNDQVIAGVDALGEAILAQADPKSPPRVDIRIDKSAPWQDGISVMDAVRDAGFPKFSLLTIAPQTKQPGSK